MPKNLGTMEFVQILRDQQIKMFSIIRTSSIRSIALVIFAFNLTACSNNTTCANISDISNQISGTLTKIVSEPGNSYNSELATQIKLLSKIKGSSEIENSTQDLISNIESLMTSLNSQDMASAGKAVDAMTTSIQILTSFCNS